MMIPQALLLDMDDTIVDTSRSYRAAILGTIEAFGARATNDDVAAAKAAGGANDEWLLSQRLLAERGVSAAYEDVKRVFEDLYQGVPGRPGLKLVETLLVSPATIRAWAARLPLGIVTGRPRSDAHELLDRFELGPCFGAVVTMDDGPLKPNPAPIRLALARLGVERAWMVGDTPDDVRAARGAGIEAFGVVSPADEPRRAQEALLAAGALRVLPTLDELSELLPGGARAGDAR